MNQLEKYFEKNQEKLIVKCEHYFEIYERHFSQFRNQDVHIGADEKAIASYEKAVYSEIYSNITNKQKIQLL